MKKFRRPYYTRGNDFVRFEPWGVLGDTFISPPHLSGLTYQDDEQFIGISDDKGLPIYEGDVLECTSFLGYTYIGVVKFDPPSLGFKINTYTDDPVGWQDYSRVLVIGNIHKNPEYLPS